MDKFDITQHIYLIFQNKIFMITATVWMVGQAIKIVVNLLYGKKFDFRWILGTGGMPSSHAAGVTALSTACGLEYGFSSGVFALSAIFALVTMFDAQGVRRSTGQQAEILNKLVDDMYWHKRLDGGVIGAFVGHTPIQVLVGFVMGATLALFLY